MAPPSQPYSWITLGAALDALQLRLNSTGADFWTRDEIKLYLAEALREWNALTGTYVQDWTATYDGSSAQWQALGSVLNGNVGPNPTSPRWQTLDSNYIFTLGQYHLLEPATGGAWSGTSQYSITDFSNSLQRRRDYLLQQVVTNLAPLNPISTTLGSSRVYFPDSSSQSVLDVRRARFIPDKTFGDPVTLYREDGLAFEYFENDYTTAPTGTSPFAYDLISGPPLAFTLDVGANVPSTLDILAILSGGVITPPTASPLLIPDDWYWVLKFGMLSDLFRMESESQDLERADYCEGRFQEGIQLMKHMPWILQARINNVPVDTPSIAEMDEYAYGWDSDPNAQLAIVRGGIDLFALSPNPLASAVGYGEGGFGNGGYGGTGSGNISVTMSLVGNMPIPATDADYVQVGRDVFDYIMDEAEHLACLKMGGFEFAESTRTLHKNFIQAAINTNNRLDMSGIFETTLRTIGFSRQSLAQPRFATQEAV